MRSIKIISTLTAFMIATLLIPANLSSRLSAHAQDVEAQAVAGDLDTTFGNGGKVTTSFPGFQGAFGYVMALQPDGKIVVAGEVESDTADDFGVSRYNTDGSLDSTFGIAGRVTTDFFGFREFAKSVAIQNDGKILVGGSCKTSGSDASFDFALARYNTDGSLDTGFGSGGKVSLDLGGNAEELLNTILVQFDGRIVVVGGTLLGCCTNGFHTGLARFNPNGSLDTSFGLGGKVVSTLVNPQKAAFAAGGRILVAGSIGLTSAPGSGDFGMARFNSDGSLDTNFGSSGIVSTDFFGHRDDALDVIFQADGKIVLAGTCATADDSFHQDFGLARYSAEGVPATTFGNVGKVTTDFGGTQDRAVSVVQYTGGRIVAGGWTEGQTSTTRDFALVQYQPDGTLDSTFGAGGKVITGFSNGSVDAMSTIAATPDGRAFVAAGSTNISIAVARYVALGEPPNFSISFERSPITVDRGTTVKVHVLINRSGGFSGNVTVTPPDASGLGVKFKPPFDIPTTEDSVIFKLKIKGSAIPGPHQLTASARDDAGRTATATLTLLIQ